jgi:hypothetical protein
VTGRVVWSSKVYFVDGGDVVFHKLEFREERIACNLFGLIRKAKVRGLDLLSLLLFKMTSMTGFAFSFLPTALTEILAVALGVQQVAFECRLGLTWFWIFK